jgi:protein involved in polysaccharide export with SLBB domain
MTFTQHAVPAGRLPNQFAAPSKSALVPINFSVLGRSQPEEHLLDTGDILAITVPGVIPPDSKELPPIVQDFSQSLQRQYYPAYGDYMRPGIGIPITIQSDGSIHLPLINPLNARGLTPLELAEEIRQAYIARGIVREGNDQINLTLIRTRVNRVLVLREDVAASTVGVLGRNDPVLHKRGSADLVDLPVYESDVLHALAASGGLPGVDANNEVWVLRKRTLEVGATNQIQQDVANGTSPQTVIENLPAHLEAIRIPLKLCPGEPIPFAPEDVVLEEGDIVYIEPRRDDYFYTGGLLPGGRVAMPRDEDLDVLEAVALAQGSTGGFGGIAGTFSLGNGGTGNILQPSRVLILRKLPNGDQLPIRVDLNRAMRDPNERVRIMAGDHIMMYFKPAELAGNTVLKFFTFNWAFRGN